MSMLKLSEDRIAGLFNKLEKDTENFTKFNVNILRKNTLNILIFRLMLGLSRNQFADFFNVDDTTVWNSQ